MSELHEVDREFRPARLGDVRRSARLAQMARRLAENPGESFPKLFSEAELEASYRFLNNDAVSPEAILEPHVLQTLVRLQSEPVLLALHDSSTMSFGSEGYRDGLGDSTGGHQHFLAHVSLAVSADGERVSAPSC